MSQHNLSYDDPRESEKEEESDEDFLPDIPGMLLQQNEDAAVISTVADCHISAERRKRQRSLAGSDGADDTLSESLCSSKDRHHNKNNGKSLMELLNTEGFPCPLLFERSYRHSPSVHDVGVLQDDIGALIVTIDAAGTLRAWRKLPRGTFFMGECQGLFSQSTLAGEESGGTAEHFILAGILTSSLFVVRVRPSVEMTAGVVEVSVEVRQVNPVLMAVELRFSFRFNVSLRCNGGLLAHWKESVTQRPFLLHHEYQPYLAFFIAEKGEVSNVVLAPCIAEPKGAPRYDGSTIFLSPVPLSTAGIVLCCRQHSSSGLVVLVDEKGIIDYARIVTRPGSDGGPTVVLLQVVSGVPSCGAADTLMLRKWITFERRQKTGFFSLLRERVTAIKSERRILPLCVSFSPTGKYFLVASVVLGEKSVSVCFHVFEFASGALLCRGETEETLAPSLCGADALQMTLWLMRGAVYDVVVDDALGISSRGGAGGIWVFLPEVVCRESHDGRVCGRRIFVFRVASSLSVRAPLKKTPTTESRHMDCGTAPAETVFYIEQLSTPIGNLEKSVSEAALQMFTPPFSHASAGQQHFAVPLALLRLVVPASQALKNIVAQSPVGSALSHEDVKRLFVVPSNARASETVVGNEQPFGNADPTFCTTSIGGTALLFYTKYEVQLGDSDLVVLKNIAVADTTANNTNDNESQANRVFCEKTLSELRKYRNFDCDDLLQLQLSVRRVVPRELMTIEEENDDVAKNSDTATTVQTQLESSNSYDLEEQRVQRIITAAVGSAAQCETPPVRASLFVENFGVITVCFLPQFAPKAVENFIGLAKEGFYDGLTFHRVVPGFMAQGGCPLGDGTGGKSIFGGTFEDEGTNIMDFFFYPSVYWLCMANRGPNTNESQFFITVGEPASWLNGKHTVFGFVVGGKEVVQAIVRTERGIEDRPVTPVVIRRVVIVEPNQE